MSKRIPVTIVTGFLGSGKTTLLRYLLQNSDQRLAVMINEFGSVGLDGDLIRSCGFCPEEEIEGRIVELNNGCLCCTVQDDFLPTIEKLLLRSDVLDGIIIETSGLALPKPLIQAFEWPQIRSKVFVNGVVTLVDSEALNLGSPVGDLNALEQQREKDESLDHLSPIEELFGDQLSCADVVLLSRSDRINSTQLKDIKKHISKSLREGTAVIPISFGNVNPSLVLGINNEYANNDLSLDKRNNEKNDDHHQHDHDHDHLKVISTSVRLEANILQTEIEHSLSSLIFDFQILRLKGRFWFPGRELPLQVQMVGPRFSSWFEKVPDNVWRPKKGGTELVALSLMDGVDDEIKRLFEENHS